VIVSKLSANLGFEVIDKQLIDETQKQFQVSAKKLKDTLSGKISFLNNISHERENNIAYLKFVLAKLLSRDNLIYHGFASLLLPYNITHILKVCILANQDYRIKKAMEEHNLKEQNAKSAIRKDDEKRYNWAHHLHQLSPWDEKLYDIIIPMHSSTVQDAVSLISENISKPALATTADSKIAMEDFLITSKVSVPLIQHGYDVNIKHSKGTISISLKEYVIRFNRVKEKIMKIVKNVEGVKNIEVTMPSSAHVPSRYDELKPSPRFLLVDDEKEFVQTLSDRLQTRDLTSSIAFDGEDALSQIEKDEPDVMVLDLKMPGINGMDVLRKVKKERPHVEVIILTGHGSEQDKILALELGAFAYLEKPVDIEVLSKTMKDAYRKINKDKQK
jgi:CheY-like chemotaxis protein/cytidylate kinase